MYQVPNLDSDTEIRTEEQAVRWVEELLTGLREARWACDAPYPGTSMSVAAQRRAERLYLLKHGGALGVLTALWRSRVVGDEAYRLLRAEIMTTLTPTVVGVSR